MNKEKVKKVVVWRGVSTLLGWAISYLYLGSITRSLEMTVIIGFTLTIVHYFLERWWDNEGR